MKSCKLLILVCVSSLAMSAGVRVAPAAPPVVFNPEQSLKDRVQQRLALTNVSIQRLGPTSLVDDSFAVPVRLGDRVCVLKLWPKSLRSPDFRLLVQDAGGALTEQPAPPPATYRGSVAGMPDSIVAASLIDDRLSAAIRLDRVTLWTIQPLAGRFANADDDAHAVYSNDDLLGSGGTCGNDDPPGVAVEAGTADDDPRDGPALAVEIAFDADFEFFELNNRSIWETLGDIEQVMNGVDAIYRGNVNISNIITTVIVRTDENDPYTFLTPEYRLDQMRDHWNANHADLPRDTAHLMTGSDLWGTIVGVAYVGVICHPIAAGYGYGLSQSHYSQNLAERVALTAHELGHNWNAEHCNGAGDCSIMCSVIGECTGNLTTFGSRSLATITAFRDAATCLAPPPNDLVYVDGRYVGIEEGTLHRPYNTVVEGVNALDPGGQVIITSGSYDERLTILKSMTLTTYSGSVVIGD